MKSNPQSDESNSAKLEIQEPWSSPPFCWKFEPVSILILLITVVYFLTLSWRKWSDPLIDGSVWYNSWQLSLDASLYRDIPFVYGPLIAYFDAFLFKSFEPGMMVLITANLLVYGLILTLIYFTFRKAWGWLGAFVASFVFISVFSFSQFQGCGNFNFVAPYSHEIIYGTLLTLVATIIAARWCRKKSNTLALLLGLCGGFATILKPEFMLACGFLGGGALLVRCYYRHPPSLKELLLASFGLMLPTLIFTITFAQTRPWKVAFADASQAWWQVAVSHVHTGSALQRNAVGLNDPWGNGLEQLAGTASAIIIVGCIWAMGWILNCSWPLTKRLIAILCAMVLLYVVSCGHDWLEVGVCLPGLVTAVFLLLLKQLRRERESQSSMSQTTAMSLMLTLVAAAMLARMFLRPRIYDFGFFQAAFAAMVAAAAIVTFVPRWVGSGRLGRRVALGGCLSLLGLACLKLGADSRLVRLAQTQSIGSGRDRFYAFNLNFDSTGALVNWVVKSLNSIPPRATVLALPEGAIINYLSRHKHPLSFWIPLNGGSTTEEVEQIISRLEQSPPDYVVFISRSMKEHGLKQFGAPGTPGAKTLNWINANYLPIAAQGGDPLTERGGKGAVILQRKNDGA